MVCFKIRAKDTQSELNLKSFQLILFMVFKSMNLNPCPPTLDKAAAALLAWAFQKSKCAKPDESAAIPSLKRHLRSDLYQIIKGLFSNRHN